MGFCNCYTLLVLCGKLYQRPGIEITVKNEQMSATLNGIGKFYINPSSIIEINKLYYTRTDINEIFNDVTTPWIGTDSDHQYLYSSTITDHLHITPYNGDNTLYVMLRAPLNARVSLLGDIGRTYFRFYDETEGSLYVLASFPNARGALSVYEEDTGYYTLIENENGEWVRH